MSQQSQETVVVVPREITAAQADVIGMPQAMYARAVGFMAVGSSVPTPSFSLLAPASPDPLLEEAGERMQQMIGYMVHDDGCTTNRFPGADVCSCGMRGALSEARAFLAKLGRA